METAKLRHNLHSPCPLNSPCDRRILVNGEVRTTMIVVPRIGAQHAPQVSLVSHDDMVEALAPD